MQQSTLHVVEWNPSTRKRTIITASRPRLWLHHNFYYDPTPDDHRILFSDKNCYTFYSCNKGNWSEIEDFPRELTLTPSNRVISVDGCFYSINVDKNGEIVCFDTRDGKLHKFGQPNNVERVVSLYAVASGRLYLHGCVKDDDDDDDDMRFRTWAMEKNNLGRFEKWVMDNNVCVSRKLIDMENEKVADLYLKNEKDGVCSVRYLAFHPSNESRIFPYSENLYNVL